MTGPLLDYHPPQPDAGRSLRLPAIFLIIAGSVPLLFLAMDFISRMIHGLSNPDDGGFHAYFGLRFGSPAGSVALNGLSVILLAIMVLGAVAMLRLRHYPLAVTGAVVAIIPLTATCCCFLTLPFGIWALVRLLNPNVKASFR